MSSKRTASVFGSTGLIGSYLVDFLKNDNYYDNIKVCSREDISFEEQNIINHNIDFSNYKSILSVVKNSTTVFICIGTTQSRVNGDKSEYRKIDYQIPIDVAKACKESKVKRILLVSSAGADVNGYSFYIKLKGEIENDIIKINIPSTYIFRPSLLLGNRKEFRPGEKIAQYIMPLFSFLMPRIYRPISAKKVAKSMIEYSKKPIKGHKIYHYDEIND
tara:strand:+ start:277 stop:930 length:654 start_codon:yes stop_codon:yes gene_type:complete